jgi:hypothetical protein
MATSEDILNCVRSLLWSGEFDEGEVAFYIRDHYGELGDAGKRWLLDVIRSEFEDKRKAEETWPKVTDFDRLDRAFTMLEAQGIIALHRAGFDQSDGIEQVENAYHESGRTKSDYAGHCFYTEQDQEGALDGSGLYISFGHRAGIDAKAVKVGESLRAELEREGFNVEWDGMVNSRLFVSGFRWQRRSPS